LTPESPLGSQNELASLKTYPVNLEVLKENQKETINKRHEMINLNEMIYDEIR